MNQLAVKKDLAMRAIHAISNEQDTASNRRLEVVRDLIMLLECVEETLEDETMGMKTKQEPKYKIKGRIVNRQSGQAIPDDEPIFILRARDVTAVELLKKYGDLVKASGCNTEHRTSVQKRVDQFSKFAADNPDRMKVPDTTLTNAWDL